MRLRAATFLLLLAVAAVSHAVPAIVIVQARVRADHDSDSNLFLGHYLAQELQDGGKVAPIVWSLEDAIFRSAVEEKLIAEPRGNPTLEAVLQGASKLHADYVFVMSVWREGEAVKARGALLRRGSVVWFDPDAKSGGVSNDASMGWARQALGQESPAPKACREVLVSATDAENGVRSLARTWALLLSSEPFKNLPVSTQAKTPDPDQGQQPIAPDPLPARAVNNNELMAQVDGLVKDGRLVVAVNLMRDAVDTEPMDAERRRRLAELLILIGRPREAAEGARAAANLLPERPHLWALAAEAWLAAGAFEEAQADVNELIARVPENPDARMLIGQIRLHMLDSAGAITHFSQVLESAPTNAAYFLRGLAHALAGHADEAAADDAKSLLFSVDEPQKPAWRYATATDLFDQAAAGVGSQLRDLIPIARVRPKDKDVARAVEERWAQVDAVLAALARIPVPEAHKRSAARRELALKLLAQSVGDFRAYLRSGDEEILGDATINLGEALKNLAAAKEAAQAEVSTER